MAEKDDQTAGAEGNQASDGGGSGNNDADPQKLFQEQLEKAVAEKLQPIKTSLDTAYQARDEALKRVAEFEKQARDAEIKRLEEEGKHREAYEKRLEEERTTRLSLEQENVRLTRDINVKDAMSGLPFRSDSAYEMTFKEITSQLVRNEKGEWVHKSGVSIKDFVKSFSENDDNAFLFKSKASTGTGSTGTSLPPSGSGEQKSLFNMPQEEVLKLAAAGKLRRP